MQLIAHIIIYLSYRIYLSLMTTVRPISSSQDTCRCQNCRNPPPNELKLPFNRKNVCHVNMYKHLKKREGPPIKMGGKELSNKGKVMWRKDQADNARNNAATPIKQGNKIAVSPDFLLEYHPVSHSQRLKPIITLPHDRRPQIRPAPESLSARLVEISQNPENVRMARQAQEEERSRSTSVQARIEGQPS